MKNEPVASDVNEQTQEDNHVGRGDKMADVSNQHIEKKKQDKIFEISC